MYLENTIFCLFNYSSIEIVVYICIICGTLEYDIEYGTQAISRAASSQPVNVEESPHNEEIMKEADTENAEGSGKEITEVESTIVEKMKVTHY